jgi:hypothetical protein
MCGAPERLTAFGARTFLVLSQQNGSQERLLEPLNIRELYTTQQNHFGRVG